MKAVNLTGYTLTNLQVLIMSSISSSLTAPWLNTDTQVRAVGSNEAHAKPTNAQFTVKEEDHADALDFFNDAASWNRVKVKLESDQPSVDDFGGGKGTYHTVKFSFVPDRADGTFSPEYVNKTERAIRMFEGRMSSAGITNYAPVE
ncbi:hypothetical protein EXW72_06745 [Pseudomonas sp. BCA14]|uniref:hypothetical protein n=1 Tax=unclassified Pseudomonas TaxID=196821 RepID=UPI00106E17C0|nr:MULTISPECIES: hypothetical protein [unclassified Pseudomonas]TFF14019.1 hypothetical protein EXW70_05745 [Pseudomonas sp. JMN1]TFF15298.1 hypothetical protein EXW71_03295 [Pseudomonas sp. BCA17]TFF31705.1 hypothetical protein EXW72_06745 [Pseudomonas sp. BCA14]TFF32657.1 hypothetical protein EXW73_02545 [Pseudomonas sp. BCA13]